MTRKFHGQRSGEGYSPWGHKELDTTEHAHAYIFLSKVLKVWLGYWLLMKKVKKKNDLKTKLLIKGEITT